MTNCCTNNAKTATPNGAGKCPECGSVGTQVTAVTLKHMVKPVFLDAVDKPGFLFCSSPNCQTVYFHPDGEVFRRDQLRVCVGLKEVGGSVPLCYCFGFTQAMVAEEIRETGECTIPQLIAAEIKAGHCACEARNPQGTCCLGKVTAAVKGLKMSAR
jgi:hypothetical protein